MSADVPPGGFVTQIGEAFVGTGAEAAHLNTVLGAKGGPVETAWVTALATPREGHVAFLTTVRPGIPAKPMTLFVNKATLAGDAHATMTWGPAEAGVASGVLRGWPTGSSTATWSTTWCSWPRCGSARRQPGPGLREQPHGHPRRPGRRGGTDPVPGRGTRIPRPGPQRVLPARGVT